jgi:hypothetical protein
MILKLRASLKSALSGVQRNSTYSALLASTSLFVTLVLVAFCVLGETAASKYTRDMRRLHRATRGTLVVDITPTSSPEGMKDVLEQIQSAAEASGFQYMVRRIAYQEVSVGGNTLNVPVVGVGGSLPLGKGWKNLQGQQSLVTESLASTIPMGAVVIMETEIEMQLPASGTEFEIAGIVREPVPLFLPKVGEGVLSYSLKAWDAYLAMDMESWISLFGEAGLVQVVIRDGENETMTVFQPDRNQLYSTLAALQSPPQRANIWRWYIPEPSNANLFRIVAYCLSSIAVVSGAAAVFSCANSIALLRSREIALMRAVGADVKQISSLLSGEVVLLVILGGMPGTIVGAFISLPILGYLGMSANLAILISQSAIAFLICLAVALFSSHMSLLRVARKRPAEVLRWSGGLALR